MKAGKRTISESKFNRVWNDPRNHKRFNMADERSGFSFASLNDHVYVHHVQISENHDMKRMSFRFEKEWLYEYTKKAAKNRVKFFESSMDYTFMIQIMRNLTWIY